MNFLKLGACFTTNGGSEKFTVTGAGENNGLQVVTVHEDANLFDSAITSEDILGTNGVNFAVVDSETSVVTALRTRGQSVQIGSVASVGLTRTTVDNSDLEFSLIGRMSCVNPGDDADSDSDVESDFLARTLLCEPIIKSQLQPTSMHFVISQVGLDFGGSKYTRDNCQTAKDELLARYISCTLDSGYVQYRHRTRNALGDCFPFLFPPQFPTTR